MLFQNMLLKQQRSLNHLLLDGLINMFVKVRYLKKMLKVFCDYHLEKSEKNFGGRFQGNEDSRSPALYFLQWIRRHNGCPQW